MLLTKKEQIEEILNCLQKIFIKINIKDIFEDYFFMNWTEEKYFEGNYSFPTINEKLVI